MWNNKAIKFQVIIGLLMSLLWMGCENFEEADQIQKKEPGTIMTEDLSESSSLFDSEGLDRITQHLSNSLKAHDQSSDFAILLQLINVGYDWKRDPETTKTYLQGGENHTVGKILQELALNRFSDEVHLGLIEIIQHHELLDEIITYFTQPDFISKEDLVALKLAIQDENVEVIKQHIDKLYVQFIKTYGAYFHLESQWTPQKENETTTYVFNKTGGGECELSTIHEKTELKMVFKEGNPAIAQETSPSELRVETVELITELIKKYFEIPRLRGE